MKGKPPTLSLSCTYFSDIIMTGASLSARGLGAASENCCSRMFSCVTDKEGESQESTSSLGPGAALTLCFQEGLPWFS